MADVGPLQHGLGSFEVVILRSFASAWFWARCRSRTRRSLECVALQVVLLVRSDNDLFSWQPHLPNGETMRESGKHPQEYGS